MINIVPCSRCGYVPSLYLIKSYDKDIYEKCGMCLVPVRPIHLPVCYFCEYEDSEGSIFEIIEEFNNKLLPCPFCNGKPRISYKYKWKYDYGDGCKIWNIEIMCDSCQPYNVSLQDICSENAHIIRNISILTERWNKRCEERFTFPIYGKVEIKTCPLCGKKPTLYASFSSCALEYDATTLTCCGCDLMLEAPLYDTEYTCDEYLQDLVNTWNAEKETL